MSPLSTHNLCHICILDTGCVYRRETIGFKDLCKNWSIGGATRAKGMTTNHPSAKHPGCLLVTPLGRITVYILMLKKCIFSVFSWWNWICAFANLLPLQNNKKLTCYRLYIGILAAIFAWTYKNNEAKIAGKFLKKKWNNSFATIFFFFFFFFCWKKKF